MILQKSPLTDELYYKNRRILKNYAGVTGVGNGPDFFFVAR